MKTATALVVCTWLGCSSGSGSDVEIAKAEPIETASPSVIEVDPPPPASAAPVDAPTAHAVASVPDPATILSSAPLAGTALTSLGGASVSGGSVANAGSVVAGMAPGFRRCFNAGLKEDPKMQGTVRITAKIGPGGEVLGASPSGGGGLSDTVIACVAARVAGAQFAAPEGGGATIVIPVTFSQAGP